MAPASRAILFARRGWIPASYNTCLFSQICLQERLSFFNNAFLSELSRVQREVTGYRLALGSRSLSPSWRGYLQHSSLRPTHSPLISASFVNRVLVTIQPPCFIPLCSGNVSHLFLISRNLECI